MAYTFEIIKKNEQAVSAWSGGTTTQLAIYPRDAEYANRNFIWRISSASVDAYESVFTSLPGIWRLIMIIEGEMRLVHEGHHEAFMKPFDQDSFSGEWTTTSFGRVRDFNLMLREGCRGSLKAILVRQEEVIENMESSTLLKDGFSKASAAYYCTGGGLNISINESKNITLNDGDLLIINMKGSGDKINICINKKEDADADIIKAVVLYN